MYRSLAPDLLACFLQMSALAEGCDTGSSRRDRVTRNIQKRLRSSLARLKYSIWLVLFAVSRKGQSGYVGRCFNQGTHASPRALRTRGKPLSIHRDGSTECDGSRTGGGTETQRGKRRIRPTFVSAQPAGNYVTVSEVSSRCAPTDFRGG